METPATREPRAAHAILDVRDEAAFCAGHLPGSANIPRAELKARRAELPARDAKLIVAAQSPAEAAAAAADLGALGYVDVGWLEAAVDSLPTATDRGPSARLWRPSPFLEEVLPQLPRGRAFDFAAGAGRESVFLALHGFEVEAWDHDRGALERASALAARHGVTIRTAVRNLERRDPELPVGTAQLVTVFRFLHRPLFPHLERALAPGGHLVYETYRRGQARFGRPKHPRFLLDDGELARAFPSLTVVKFEEVEGPEGPVIARLLARRDG